MEVFNNLVNGYHSFNKTNATVDALCGNIKLKNSEFVRLKYCEKNFNNVVKSFNILFDLMNVNQWHSIFF